MGPVIHHGFERVLGWVLEKRVLLEKVPLYLGESLLKLTGIFAKANWQLKMYLFHHEKQWQHSLCVK